MDYYLAAEDYGAFTQPVLLFMTLYPVLTGAIGSAGFSLAMADMVLEMKCQHAAQGRWDEPTLAGLFMGVNALFCKPTEAILPIITATLLGGATTTAAKQSVLFKLLVIPPLVCGALQFYVWSKYNLTPTRTQVLRKELEAAQARAPDEPKKNVAQIVAV